MPGPSADPDLLLLSSLSSCIVHCEPSFHKYKLVHKLIISVSHDQGYDKEKHQRAMEAEKAIRESFLEEVTSDSFPVPIFQPLYSCSLIFAVGTFFRR